MHQLAREQRTRSAFGFSIVLLLVVLAAGALSGRSDAAQFRTTNFVVTAPSAEQARLIAEAAEHHRRELSLEWTGRVMPKWTKPCPIKTKIGNVGAGGATTFSFDRGEVFGWKMTVQGSMERILDSVIPHEVNHTVFACYFRRPLPRWADEGAATLTEHESEKNRQTRLLNQVIRTSRRIPLAKLLSMTEYPTDMKDVLTLYAEGYALADLLVQQRGKATYLKFLHDAHDRGWEFALKRHYSYKSIDDLERYWSDWVIAGSQPIAPEGQMLASNGLAGMARGQSESITPSTNSLSMSSSSNNSAVDSSSLIANSGKSDSRRKDIEIPTIDLEDRIAAIASRQEFGVEQLSGVQEVTGVREFSRGRESAGVARKDRSQLSFPVHQVPLRTAAQAGSYAAFKPVAPPNRPTEARDRPPVTQRRSLVGRKEDDRVELASSPRTLRSTAARKGAA